MSIQLLWCILLILLPVALVFSDSSMSNIQTVSIIAAFPVGVIMIMIIWSFLKDAKKYMREIEEKKWLCWFPEFKVKNHAVRLSFLMAESARWECHISLTLYFVIVSESTLFLGTCLHQTIDWLKILTRTQCPVAHILSGDFKIHLHEMLFQCIKR